MNIKGRWHLPRRVRDTFRAARLRRFRYLWTPESGEHLLVSRAIDEQGRTQPRDIAEPAADLRAIHDDAYPWNQRGCENNAYLPHGVRVIVDA